MASPKEIQGAISALRERMKKHRPGKGFNVAVRDVELARLDVVTHNHCAACSALVINKKGNDVSFGCTAKFNPLDLWLNKDHDGVAFGKEPECIGYDGP